MHVFVPLSDELLYEHPDSVPDDCRPYQCGMICLDWLTTEPGQDNELRREAAASQDHHHEK